MPYVGARHELKIRRSALAINPNPRAVLVRQLNYALAVPADDRFLRLLRALVRARHPAVWFVKQLALLIWTQKIRAVCVGKFRLFLWFSHKARDQSSACCCALSNSVR